MNATAGMGTVPLLLVDCGRSGFVRVSGVFVVVMTNKSIPRHVVVPRYIHILCMCGMRRPKHSLLLLIYVKSI